MFILGGLLSAVVFTGLVAALELGLAPWQDQEEEINLVLNPLAPPEGKEIPKQTAALSPSPPLPPPLTAPISPRIQTAIDKGVAHLKKRLLEKSADPYCLDKRYASEASIGAMALCGLALLEAKVSPHDPAVQAALTAVRQEGPKLSLVYALSTCLFFLNRLHDVEALPAADRDLLRSLALRLAAGQMPDGRWTYLNPPLSALEEADLLARLSAGAYAPSKRAGAGANSMTQFAMLALWGSRRHDLPVRPVLLAAAASFRKSQAPDGTWSYGLGVNPAKMRLDSNTCAGLIALAMEETLFEDRTSQERNVQNISMNTKADEQCVKAFAYLASVIGRSKEDPTAGGGVHGDVIRASAWGDYYFLWCLERVGVIYDRKRINGKDWYAWGARVIIAHQLDDGSWLDRHGDVCDTCFALLFLTRGNLAKDLTDSIRARAGH